MSLVGPNHAADGSERRRHHRWLVYREVREGVEPARIGYSAHWREDNQNPALTSFLKVLGERYPLPTADV